MTPDAESPDGPDAADTPEAAAGSAVPRRSLFLRLYHGETHYRFVERSKLWFSISAVIILLGLGALLLHGGLNLGIDFTGGNQWEIPAGDASPSEVEDAVAELGFSDVGVQEVGDNIRVQTEPLDGTARERRSAANEVVDELVRLTGSDENDVVSNEVGPSWGAEISEKAGRALVFFLIAIVIYITIRFEFRMALATLGALIHDILVVIGVYALLQLPVTPATVVAFLTILGFSIYDGIVVFDRVDENTRLLTSNARMTYSAMVDRSLNEVLMRSLNTQITALIPMLSILLVGSLALGAETLQEFGLALFVGQMSGAYSSIFIASPLLAILKEREPRYKALRRRLAEREAAGKDNSVSRLDDSADDTESDEAVEVEVGSSTPKSDTRAKRTSVPARPSSSSRSHPPRPRKKGKRR